uniref:Uncharacterized protein n=1 Tax=Megaselia scalaris TaxID=36166 RepID=T1GN30_MEGSC
MGSRADQSYSSTFGIKMINHQPQNNYPNSQPQNDEYHLRLKSLNKTLIQRIQKEVDETNQRIQRYSEQQFALLKNFREKSESEYQNLVSLVKNVPENLFEMQFYNDPDLNVDQGVEHPTTNATDASDSSAINNTSDTQPQPTQITSFDTPPATPESTPMSVGNSPVFRQQQQQQSIANNVFNGMRGLLSAVNNGAVHTNNTSIIRNTNINNNNNNNNLDDCVFELEGLETYPTSVSGNCNNGNNMSDDEDDNETEDAQDALGELDSNPSYGRRYTIASSLNVAKSVPIGIAQSVENDQQNQMSRSRRNNIDSDDEVLGDNIDIAASMKALARSLHGNQVFGELPPRPRLYSYKI